MNKTSFYKFITIIGLIVVTLLQLFWTINTYKLMKNYYIDAINRQFIKSINKELYIEFTERYPKIQLLLVSFPKDEFGMGKDGTDLAIGQVMYGLKKNMNIRRLDSIYTASLKGVGLYSQYKLIMVNKKLQIVFSIRNKLKSYFSLSTKLIPIKLDKTIAIQAIIMSPYKDILSKMTLLLIATVLMFILILYCIVYQIRIIIRQKKIATVREDFSYAMVHDMKTPLSSILMGAHVLRSGKLESKPEKKERYFNIIEEETQRLLALINKILLISKLENEKIELKKEWVDIQALLAHICEKFKLKANKEITFSIALNASRIYADEEYLKEVIENIIDNSIKYSNPKQVHITIVTENDEKECCSIIRIKDDGIGMSEEDMHVIFDKFERASAVKRTPKGGATGFGLGLNYVFHVMKAHNGKIEVNSEKNKYSEFALFFPL